MTANIRVIVGTRPQIIKLASLVKAFDSEELDYSIIHTGQHYDFEMDQAFFRSWDCRSRKHTWASEAARMRS